MKLPVLKKVTWYAILALFAVIALLPLLKGFAPTFDSFRDLDCQGMSCPEGQFCKSNQCVTISPRYPNAVPTGDQ